MNKAILSAFLILTLSLPFWMTSCSEEDYRIPIPMTEQFAEKLSAYNIYQGDWKDLIPSPDFHLLELSSPLFSNYAIKQRLVKLPEGTQMAEDGDGLPVFPNGTILVKTFFYYHDERDESQGKRVMETRLLIKKEEQWNVASYVWNESQTEATVAPDGLDTEVSWTNVVGTNRSIMYHVPNQDECASCHQLHEDVVPLGPSMRNLNLEVRRNNELVNQLDYLQSLDLLGDFDISQISQIPNYKDESLNLVDRGRAYLEMNCAHCHRPSAWRESSSRSFDFRYETSLGNTHLLEKKEDIIRVVTKGEMPFLGNTVIDEEGVDLIVAFVEGL